MDYDIRVGGPFLDDDELNLDNTLSKFSIWSWDLVYILYTIIINRLINSKIYNVWIGDKL